MEDTDDNDLILHELKKISKILTLANAEAIEDELSKIANSNARKKMWVLIDGEKMPNDLAREAGVTAAAVSYFLKAAAKADFIKYVQREPPRKILDYTPPSWIELIESSAQTIEARTNQSDNEGTSND